MSFVLFVWFKIIWFSLLLAVDCLFWGGGRGSNVIHCTYKIKETHIFVIMGLLVTFTQFSAVHVAILYSRLRQ